MFGIRAESKVKSGPFERRRGSGKFRRTYLSIHVILHQWIQLVQNITIIVKKKVRFDCHFVMFRSLASSLRITYQKQGIIDPIDLVEMEL